MRKEYPLFDVIVVDTDDFTEPFFEESLIEVPEGDLSYEELEGDHELLDTVQDDCDSQLVSARKPSQMSQISAPDVGESLETDECEIAEFSQIATFTLDFSDIYLTQSDDESESWDH